MNGKEKEILGRIDERIKGLHDKVDVVIQDNTEQWKVLNSHNEDLTKHTTYFKIMGWVLGSGTILGILVQGAVAFFKK